jgi:uncharacterized protein (TIGR03032 family)
MKKRGRELKAEWGQAAAEWRDPAQIASHWREATTLDPRLLESRVRGDWWGLLQRLDATLFVTREYEHLVVGLSAPDGHPHVTFFPVPHPSGLIVDRAGHRVFLASTRNPNQVYILKPATNLLERSDTKVKPGFVNPLMPATSAFYPGSLYMHDLALIGGELHANAVGLNSVVRLHPEGQFRNVWWPRCIERGRKPVFDRNYIQLNSIAPGTSTRDSYYSASSCTLGRFRPGHLRYKVDKQGVIFSGRTRQPVCFGLTRPHSARLWKGRVWVANSGYGELGYVNDGKFEVVLRLPGWTRGLCLTSEIAFVATSRVIPRYSRYAPGLDYERSRCGVHAVCLKTGRVLGSIEWPSGNQVFAIDWINTHVSPGFVFQAGRRKSRQEKALFYRYLIDHSGVQ